MEFLYRLTNASLAIRVVERLNSASKLPLDCMTVLHQLEGWIVKVKLSDSVKSEDAEDFRAFCDELGIPYDPSTRVRMALWALETGESPVDVMHHYQVAVISHGRPDRDEIEAFREQFATGLGYCPETLA